VQQFICFICHITITIADNDASDMKRMLVTIL